MRKFLAMLLALVMVLGLMAPVAMAEEVETENSTDDIVILYTNDVHTYIDNTWKDSDNNVHDGLRYSTVAAYRDTLENVLLVDAGDHIQGTAYGGLNNGETIIELMNAAGYDLATLGNHEFDYGMDGCMNAIAWANYPYVSCNFYHEENGVVGDSVLDAYKVFEVNGVKIAFIGITTPESFTKSTPAYFQDGNGNYIYGIAGGSDGEALYAAVQAAIDAASEEADYVIALGHLGDDLSSQPWTSEEVIANTTGLDAFIDGHSHSTVAYKEVTDEDGNTVVLTQTGSYLAALGQMTITADGTISTELLTAADLADVTPDADVKAIEDEWITAVDEQLGTKIATSEIDFTIVDADGNRAIRKYETNLGDLNADAYYWYSNEVAGLDCDIAIMNGGGIRASAAAGDWTYLTCKTINTFGNVLCVVEVTGQTVLDALEFGARYTTTAENGGFLHVAGMTYTVDTSIENTIPTDDKNVWLSGPTGDYRVKDVMVYNKTTGEYEPLDLNKTYTMAGTNYTLLSCGDGFNMFGDAKKVLDGTSEDYLAMAAYVMAFADSDNDGLANISTENSPLASYEGYLLNYENAQGAGRITILTAEEEEEAWDGTGTIGGLTNNLWTTKYGNIYCDVPAADFVAAGYAWGDLVTVKFLDQELVLPVVPTYSYVDSGEPAIIMAANEAGNPTGYLSLAINMGDFTTTYGLATKHTDADGNWWWEACEGVTYPVELTFEMYEQGGYLGEYILHELTRTNNREDYAELTDEEYANFRVINTTGMGENVLYRSSSPINPEIARNEYADAAIEAAGVTVIMNLADSAEDTAAYEGFADTYYANQKVIYLCLGVDVTADDFKAGLAEGLKFFAENEGTYLVHCTEGKDRAGFVSALLECLMGATYEEVVADYMVTYYNYYGIEEGSEKYEAIANSNIIKTLQNVFEVEDLSKADLAAEAKEYILSLGLTETEVTNLMINLGLVVEEDKPGTNGPAPTGDPILIFVGMAVLSLGGAVLCKKKED